MFVDYGSSCTSFCSCNVHQVIPVEILKCCRLLQNIRFEKRLFDFALCTVLSFQFHRKLLSCLIRCFLSKVLSFFFPFFGVFCSQSVSVEKDKNTPHGTAFLVLFSDDTKSEFCFVQSFGGVRASSKVRTDGETSKLGSWMKDVQFAGF